VPDSAPDFGEMSTKETLVYINQRGGDLGSTVFDPTSDVTVDGVPNDATSFDDIEDSDGGVEYDEDGFNKIGSETGVELAENIPRVEDTYADPQFLTQEYDDSIPDDTLEQAHEAIGEVLSRTRNPELAREYVKRTAYISDQVDRAQNGYATINGNDANRMTLSADTSDRTVHHEMGHGLLQMYNFGGIDSSDAVDMNYFPQYNTDTGEFGERFFGDNDDPIGVDEWESDVRAKLAGPSFRGRTADLSSLQPGDLVQLEEVPRFQTDSDATEFEVVEREERSGISETVEYTLRDRHGWEIDVKTRDGDTSPTSPDITNTNKGYSSRRAARNREETEFTAEAPDSPRNEEIQTAREDAANLDTEEYIERLASESNRAFLRMHLVERNQGREAAQTYTVSSQYSSTNAHEVISSLNEVMSDKTSTEATRKGEAKKLAYNQPRLLGTYLAGFEPSEEMSEALEDIGVDP
jgi:hypothetical protein